MFVSIKEVKLWKWFCLHLRSCETKTLSVDVPCAELSMEATKFMGLDGGEARFLSTTWFSFMGMPFNVRSWFANWTSET